MGKVSKNRPKPVLVTGANGFVGRNLAASLVASGPVNCLVRDRGFTQAGADVYVFRDPADPVVERALSRSDSVVHCAAMLHGPKKSMWEANVRYTERLLSLAEAHGITHFVFISTENVQHDLDDTYTATKRAAEGFLSRFPDRTVLRPTVLYGPGDNRYLSRLIRIVHAFPFAPVLGDGKNRFQFLYIDDLVRVVEHALRDRIFGTHVIAGPDSVTYDHLIARIQGLMNLRKPVVKIPIPLLRPLTRLLALFLPSPPLTRSQLDNLRRDRDYDISGTVRTFAYTPTPLEAGLKRLIEAEGFGGRDR